MPLDALSPLLLLSLILDWEKAPPVLFVIGSLAVKVKFIVSSGYKVYMVELVGYVTIEVLLTLPFAVMSIVGRVVSNINEKEESLSLKILLTPPDVYVPARTLIT